MASSLYNLALDFSKELNYTKAIMARQGDKGITVTVKPFLNGLQMDTSGGTFTLKGTTSSNRYVDSVATSVTSEEVTFSLDGTFMSEAGYYKHCYVEYRKDDQILTTQDIIFFSLGVSDISQGQADEYVSQLEELIQKYNETFDAFMAEIKVRVDSLNQQITDLTGQAKILQDKLDALKEEISKLGNLHVMYSNSIDFGGYDYSGNPNLIPPISFASLGRFGDKTDTNIPGVTDGGSYFEVNTEVSLASSVSSVFVPFQPRLQPNKTYTLTVSLEYDQAFIDSGASHSITYGAKIKSVIERPVTIIGAKTTTAKQTISKTFTTSAIYGNGQAESFYQLWFATTSKGKIKVYYDFKLEEGSTATPYQPNLLDEPYYLSKIPLGENIANKSVVFPIKSSAYSLYQADMEEEFVLGQTYTITIKATKPSIQTFIIYNEGSGDYRYGNLVPVEGLTDIWSLTFTPQKVGANYPKQLTIIQYPQSTVGACQIDWLKIEKGDTRTPNIDQYKYRGIGMRDSNNPKDYVWDIAPEYVEDNLATDVKISEITGKANDYTDGKVSEINSQLTASIHAVDTAAKDAQTKANANATAIKSTNSRVDEIENNLYVLGEWKTLPLENGYTGADGTTPQYRVNLVNGHRNVVFNGAISTIAGTLPSQGQQHNASTLPTELIPSGTKMGLGATSLFTTSCRLAVTGKGTLYIRNDSGKDVKYCYLDLFSYWLD